MERRRRPRIRRGRVPRGTSSLPPALPGEPLLPPDPPTDPSPELLDLLQRGLSELALDGALAGPLGRLCLLLHRWARQMSLTAHRTPEEIAHRLVLDALALDSALPADAASLVDLGSGPGFPGLPIAVAHPERGVTLVEAKERPHHFQRAAVRELALANVTPLHGRAEALEPTPHAVGVAQAMTQPERAVRLLRPWIQPGGLLAIPGAETPPQIPPDLPGITNPELRTYQVPLDGPTRTLWLARAD